jgi:hypothetical protein
MRFALYLIAAFLGAVAGPLRAASPWSELRAGLDGEEIVKLVGAPVLGTCGRGIEVWTYDQRGEVVFKGGRLMFWSAPAAEIPVERDQATAWIAAAKLAARVGSAERVGAVSRGSARTRPAATFIVNSY